MRIFGLELSPSNIREVNKRQEQQTIKLLEQIENLKHGNDIVVRVSKIEERVSALSSEVEKLRSFKTYIVRAILGLMAAGFIAAASGGITFSPLLNQ